MNIVYPPTVRYNFLYQRPQQLMNALAYSSCIDTVTFYDAHNNFKPYLTETELLVVPYAHPAPETDYLWISYPPMAMREIIRFKPKKIVFDIIDSPTGEFESWQDNWDELLSMADYVFASCEELRELALSKRPGIEVHLLPNGADYPHFAPLHEVLVPGVITRPVVGFVGAIASWLDWELINKVVEDNPSYDFKFVGPIYNECGTEKFSSYRNTTITGHVDYPDLPSYMKDMDVLIIPFDAKNPVSQTTNPIKMYEYAATGKPIVATPIPEAVKSGVCAIAANAEEFSKCLKEAIMDPYTGSCNRIKFAFNNSWDARASFVRTILR